MPGKGRERKLVIPVFIPFGGCPHQCVFCDQAGITGVEALPATGEVHEMIEKYLSTWKGGRGNGSKEAAFYGGTFTGLSPELQREYLKTAYEFVLSGRLDALRVSTRPDYISPDTIKLLKEYRVETVEIGVQSMSDEVLKKSGRGHSAGDTVRAVGLLREAGLSVGLQLMPGLPGDTVDSIVDTARKAAALKPDFVRLYPALVMKDTPLYDIYKRGEYTPWPLDEMVGVLSEAMGVFERTGIKVIRVGLQPTEDLEKSIVAGPYHPALRDLVGKGLQT
ncbi:MAG: radical SAM protein [Thermodesulfobacteriota bacterium]